MTQPRYSLDSKPPERSRVVLLLIDIINDFDFPGSAAIRKRAALMAPRLLQLKQKARAHGYAVVYVNDNFGRWRSNFNEQVDHCLESKARSRTLVEMLRPEPDDYFVLKPAHSGFYASALDLLLEHVGAETLILAGVATNICVLFTASDAYMRGYQLFVPSDCVAANSERLSKGALRQMKTVLKANTGSSRTLPWKRFSSRKSRAR
ncbi:MAG: isochorismatase family cysteine hydrolase [Bdellovibrionota bacterium]